MAEPTLEDIRALYERMRTIAVVGCSSDPTKAGNYIPRYLRAYGYEVRPVNPRQSELLGQRCYESLAEIDEPIDLVDVFRRAEYCPDVARQAVEAGAKAVWLQLGIVSPEARRIAEEAGLDYVENQCTKIVHSLSFA